MTTSIGYPYTIDPNGAVISTVSTTKLYLDRVLTLLSTNLGQRPMSPTYGVDWASAMFENDGDARIAINQAVRVAIATWIPEVTVNNIKIDSNNFDGKLLVMLELGLPNDTVSNLTINSDIFNYEGLATY
jgi:phage baseplate assembly protein W